jgi:hypothetical protein
MCGAIPTVKVPQASAEQVTEIEKMLAKRLHLTRNFGSRGQRFVTLQQLAELIAFL